jgi:hypothetical protein
MIDFQENDQTLETKNLPLCAAGFLFSSASIAENRSFETGYFQGQTMSLNPVPSGS